MKPGDLVKVIRSPSQWMEATHAVVRKPAEISTESIKIGTIALLVLRHPDDAYLRNHVRILVGETLYEIAENNVKVL